MKAYRIEGIYKMKRYSYLIVRQLNIIFGIMFFTQLPIEFLGIRKPGFQWVIYVIGAAFLLSIIYSILLILLNTRHNHRWQSKKGD